MLFLLGVAVFVLICTLAGFAFLPLMPRAYRTEALNQYWFMAPAAGATAMAASTLCAVVVVNGLGIWASLPTVVLLVAGTIAFVRNWRGGLSRGALRFYGLAAVVVLLAGLPFRYHIAPPDVDPHLFGLSSMLIKSPFGFPLTDMWPGLGTQYLFVPAVAGDTLPAGLSAIFAIDISVAMVLAAVAWVVVAMLAAVPIADAILGRRPALLSLVALAFVFSSGLIWEYGDGAYARAAAVAPTMLIAALCSISPRLRSAGLFVLIGLIHGMTLYLLYRVFIWNTFILAVWMAIEAHRGGWQVKEIRRLLLIPLFSALAIVPLLIWTYVLVGIDFFSGREHITLFVTKHTMPVRQLVHDFFRFNGLLMAIVVVLGVFAARATFRRQDAASDPLRFGFASFAGVFFCFDGLVLWVFPFTYGFLYSQMAVISNFAVLKLIFGATLLAWGYDWIASGKERATGRVLVVAAAALATAAASLAARAILMDHYDILYGVLDTQLSYYRIGVVVALACLLYAAVNVRRERAALFGCLAVVAIAFSHEMILGRFNEPYLVREERSAYRWLKQNTSATDTIVLSPANNELDRSIRDRNAARFFKPGERPLLHSLGWLPVVSERAAIFNRAVLLLDHSGLFEKKKGENPDFERLDWAFWNLDDPAALEIIEKYHVTHIYVPPVIQPAVGKTFETNPNLRLVFTSVLNPAYGGPAQIFEVRPTAD
jgi:hypothetical protein